MKKVLLVIALAALAVGLVGAATVTADSNRKDFKTQLSGFQEVPPISTTGSGRLKLRADPSGTTITFELRYENLTGVPSSVDISFGQRHVNGGIITVLCGGGTKPAACPAAPATITGTIVATDILGPAAQGIATAEFAEALRAIRNGSTYVNVHTSLFTLGEIRGQVRTHDDEHD